MSPRSTGALDGVVVLEFGDGIAVEFGGKQLAELGADVVKVEPPGGVSSRRQPPFYEDVPGVNRSVHFWYYNSSKRSVVHDMEGTEALASLRELVAGAAVVLDGAGVSIASWLGLDAAELPDAFPGLVYCRVTPFGTSGPWAEHRSSDLVQLALGGVMATCGYDDVPGAPPIAPSGGQSGHMTGVAVASGVLAALVVQARTGRGQLVDIAAHDVVSVSTEMALPYWEYQGVNARRQTGRHARPYDTPPWNHRCRDGKYVCALPTRIDDRRFGALVEWFSEDGHAEDLGDSAYASQALRSAHMPHIVDVIRRFCADHDSDDVFHGAQRRRLPWSTVNLPHELMGDPHLEARDAYVSVPHQDLQVTFRYPGAPYKFSATPRRVGTSAPSLNVD